MSTHSQQELDERFERAPEVIRKTMFAQETINAVRKIGEKYKLHIDQVGNLAEEIDCVMLGLEPSASFVKNIETRLNLEHEAAEQIAQDANSEIFLKIRESLKQLEENQAAPKPEDLLREIENPPKAAPNIFERKLSEPVNLQPTENIPPPVAETPAKNIDPYLEPLE